MPDGGVVPAFSARTATAEDHASGDQATISRSTSAETPSAVPVGPTSEPRALIYQPCRSAMVSGGKARLHIPEEVGR